MSVWVRDIELTPEQHAELRRTTPVYDGQQRAGMLRAARARETRRGYQEHGRVLARRGEPLHVTGCMLYWAEGAKARHQLQFANSDPDMIRLFVSFLRRYFGLRGDDIRISLNLFADHQERQREIEEFWLDVTELPGSCLRKSIVNVYSRQSLGKRTNMLPYGTCRVVVSRTSVVQSIYGAIQEYAGFTRQTWLDGV